MRWLEVINTIKVPKIQFVASNLIKRLKAKKHAFQNRLKKTVDNTFLKVKLSLYIGCIINHFSVTIMMS